MNPVTLTFLAVIWIAFSIVLYVTHVRSGSVPAFYGAVIMSVAAVVFALGGIYLHYFGTGA